VLIMLGVISVISASIGVIAWAIDVEGFWSTLGVLLIGAPVALLLATWPIALGQAVRAIADLGDSVTVPSSPASFVSASG
jgi:hypothetical protein